jgi:AAA+ ATPase superfamily predicted ATPase
MNLPLKNPFLFDREVSGQHFCGRKKDIRQILGHIRNGTNVIMFAKRRLGKSSLVKEIFQNHLDTHTLFAHIDIYSVSNTKELYEKIKEGIAQSLKGKENSLDKLQSMASSIQEYFGGSKITLKLSPSPSFEIEPTSRVYDEAIGDILESYFNYLEDKGLHAAIAIDEFQKIVSLPDNIKIEEVLRTAISKRKYCSFIFTGSRRSWLLSMFNSPDRPFYKLGLEHHLGPINKDVFYDWVLENFSKKDVFIDKDAFMYLYDEANGETRFVQLVSYKMFEEEKLTSIIDKKKVKVYVDEVIKGASSVPAYYNMFPIVQQNALKIVAKQDGINLYTESIFQEFNIVKGSLQSAMRRLLDVGAIYEHEGRYFLENVELGMWLKRV